MLAAGYGGLLVRQPEKRKVGGSTPPLTTIIGTVGRFLTCDDASRLLDAVKARVTATLRR